MYSSAARRFVIDNLVGFKACKNENKKSGLFAQTTLKNIPLN